MSQAPCHHGHGAEAATGAQAGAAGRRPAQPLVSAPALEAVLGAHEGHLHADAGRPAPGRVPVFPGLQKPSFSQDKTLSQKARKLRGVPLGARISQSKDRKTWRGVRGKGIKCPESCWQRPRRRAPGNPGGEGGASSSPLTSFSGSAGPSPALTLAWLRLSEPPARQRPSVRPGRAASYSRPPRDIAVLRGRREGASQQGESLGAEQAAAEGGVGVTGEQLLFQASQSPTPGSAHPGLSGLPPSQLGDR